MKFTDAIFERAAINGVVDYLLYGSSPVQQERDYTARLEEAYLAYEKIAFKYDSNEESELLSSANTMLSENASVYMELGMKAGILLIVDLFRNI